MAPRKRSYQNGKVLSTFLHNSMVDGRKRQKEQETENRRSERKRNRENVVQQRDSARLTAIELRLEALDIDAVWADEAAEIMESRGFGLNQMKTRLLPVLEQRIDEVILVQDELEAASEDVFAAMAIQVDALEKKIIGCGKRVSARKISNYVNCDAIFISGAPLLGIHARNPFPVITMELLKLLIKLGTAFAVIVFAYQYLIERTPQYEDYAIIVSIVLTVLLPILWIRGAFSNFRLKTRPELHVLTKSIQSIFKETLSEEAHSILSKIGNARRFPLIYDFSVRRIPAELRARIERISSQLQSASRF